MTRIDLFMALGCPSLLNNMGFTLLCTIQGAILTGGHQNNFRDASEGKRCIIGPPLVLALIAVTVARA